MINKYIQTKKKQTSKTKKNSVKEHNKQTQKISKRDKQNQAATKQN